MREDEVLEAIGSARMCLEALRLIGPDDYREPCFQSLLCQTLGMASRRLGEAYGILEGRAKREA